LISTTTFHYNAPPNACDGKKEEAFSKHKNKIHSRRYSKGIASQLVTANTLKATKGAKRKAAEKTTI